MSSIYSCIIKLKKLININYVFKPVVAEDVNGKVLLLLENYESKKQLKEIIINNDTKINYIYWDYNFCDINNLSENDKDYLLKKIKLDYYVKDSVALGSLLSLIVCYNLLVHTYEIEDKNIYIELLDSINIDKNIVIDFLIENKFILPLNDNYLILIKRIFKNNVKILNLIFKSKCLFSNDEIELILNEFDYGGINFASEFIFNSNYSLKQKLIYSKILINSYDEIIDPEPVLYLRADNYKPSLAYYLFSMKVDGNLTNLFFEVLKLFIDKGGAKEVYFYGNKELSDFFQCRNKQIKEMYLEV